MSALLPHQSPSPFRLVAPFSRLRIGLSVAVTYGLWSLAWPVAAQDVEPAPAASEAALIQPQMDSQSSVQIGAEGSDAVGTFPPLTKALAEKAAKASTKKDWSTARRAYEEMLAADPANALTLANLGAVEYQLKDFAKAATHLDAAVRARPALYQSWVTLGLLRYEQGEHMLALSALSRALAEKPRDFRVRNYLAIVLKELGWQAAAEAELQQALKLNPLYGEGHFNLALLYALRQPALPQLALKHYGEALKLGATKDPLLEKQIAEAQADSELRTLVPSVAQPIPGADTSPARSASASIPASEAQKVAPSSATQGSASSQSAPPKSDGKIPPKKDLKAPSVFSTRKK